MCDEGWARMCLTIPVTCLASRSASAGTRAEGTGTGARGQASDAAAPAARGSWRLPGVYGDVLEGSGACCRAKRRHLSRRARSLPVAVEQQSCELSPCCHRVLLKGTCPFLRWCSIYRRSSSAYNASDRVFTGKPDVEH